MTSADGIVGPLSWNALMPQCYGNPIPPYPGFLIRMGARGDYVRQVQTCLNSVNNAGLNPDGIFGQLTQNAVINYQRANGLSADGIIGPISWEHLMSRCAGQAISAARFPQRKTDGSLITESSAATDETTIPVSTAGGRTADAGNPSETPATPEIPETNTPVILSENAAPESPVVDIVDTLPPCRCTSESNISNISNISEEQEEPETADVFDIANAPNFAATDETETEFIQESLGIVKEVFGECPPMIPTPPAAVKLINSPIISVQPQTPPPCTDSDKDRGTEPAEPPSPAAPTSQINVNGLLMYLLVCQMNKMR